MRKHVPVSDYVAALLAELRTRQGDAPPLELDTLYFGGGTPSRLGGPGVHELLHGLARHVRLAPKAEVTLEANPEDITDDAVAAWADAGINRLSIGVQSFSDDALRWMHRVHDARAAASAVGIARANGIDDVSIDLIFSLPDKVERDWTRDLAHALALEPTHISLYGLTIEPNTPLGRWTARGVETAANDEGYETQFLEAHARLSAAGFEHYEVSNFARPGKRARHNSAYWTGSPYIGLGPSAHGFDGVSRRWNVAPYAAWQTRATAGADPCEGQELLSADERLVETVYLGLRTRDGLVVENGDEACLDPWRSAGWIEDVPGVPARRVRCTPTGWLRLDRLAADLTSLRSHW